MKRFLKKLYKNLPFKRQLFSAVRSVYVPPKSIAQHLYFNGVFAVKCGNRKVKMRHYGYQVENLIFWYGLENGFEKESVKLWMKLCKKAEVIFDIGANTGLYSLVAQAANPDAKIYAFEPVKRIAEKFRDNIRLNGYNIELIEKAASNIDGTTIIYDDDNSENNYSATLNKEFGVSAGTSNEIPIEVIRLDSFIEQNQIMKLDLIKIDVETYEPEVLEGFTNYLQLFKPAILIEILNPVVGEKVSEKVKSLGYLYFNINENGSVQKVDVITKSDSFNFLLCSPAVAKELGLC
jgi:FkbM family methyltransferase